jgi:hypothetical protein
MTLRNSKNDLDWLYEKVGLFAFRPRQSQKPFLKAQNVIKNLALDFSQKKCRVGFCIYRLKQQQNDIFLYLFCVALFSKLIGVFNCMTFISLHWQLSVS